MTTTMKNSSCSISIWKFRVSRIMRDRWRCWISETGDRLTSTATLPGRVKSRPREKKRSHYTSSDPRNQGEPTDCTIRCWKIDFFQSVTQAYSEKGIRVFPADVEAFRSYRRLETTELCNRAFERFWFRGLARGSLLPSEIFLTSSRPDLLGGT